MGFDVPTLKMIEKHADLFGEIGSEFTNKYTPASIYQDLAWAKSIFERDGIVRDDDVTPLLLELPNGKFVDLHRPFVDRFGITREKALEHRQRLYSLSAQAFRCEVIVLTLGHIEGWWDEQQGQYAEFAPAVLGLKHTGRFRFKPIHFNEAYKYVSDSLDILRGFGDKKVLITTSPVPIGRTFTEMDVITANCYSKGVLRAVAGQIAQERTGIDYFPSFETVMLTKQSYVWDPDLLHVNSDFVGRIMRRVVDHYVPSFVHAFGTQVTEIVELVRQGRDDEAKQLYAAIEKPLSIEDPNFQAAAAELAFRLGDSKSSVEHNDLAMSLALQGGEEGWYVLYPCIATYESLGAEEQSRRAWRAFLDRMKRRPNLAKWILPLIKDWGGAGHQRIVMEFVEHEIAHDLELMLMVGSIYEGEYLLLDAERIFRAAVSNHPGNSDALWRLRSIHERQGNLASAADVACLLTPILGSGSGERSVAHSSA